MGVGRVSEFVHAIQQFPVGTMARLSVIFSGHQSELELEPFRGVLASVKYSSIELPGPGWDIASYRAAASVLEGQYICFLNTYSRPLVSGWLDKLVQPLKNSSAVGLAGAGGNWNSAYWHAPRESDYGFSRLPIRGWRQRQRFRRLIDRQLQMFPKTVGPIIRTNAFAMRREAFLSLVFPKITCKFDTYLFESGWMSMSRQVLSSGQNVAVINRGGEVLDWRDWPDSGTFYSRDQETLLVADNRTDAYANANPERRQALHQLVYSPSPVSGYEPYPGCFRAAPFRR